MDVTLGAWAAVIGLVLIMLVIDLVMHREAHEISPREAGFWTAVWLAVGAVIWWRYGADFGLQYLTGYVVEKSLAIDNVFVWAVIFGHLAIPARYQHRILFYGVLGALVLRSIFIATGSLLIERFHWVLYIFGAFLIFTGIKMLRERAEHASPAESKVLAWFQRLVPTTTEIAGDAFFIRREGRRYATPLLAALVLVEVTDVIFAVDSIPAVFAVTEEPFLVFASNALAILGLRAMYFLVADLIDRFVYLKVGLSFVMMWVGAKMLIVSWVKIPIALSLGVVLLILTTAVVASLYRTRQQEPLATDQPESLTREL